MEESCHIDSPSKHPAATHYWHMTHCNNSLHLSYTPILYPLTVITHPNNPPFLSTPRWHTGIFRGVCGPVLCLVGILYIHVLCAGHFGHGGNGFVYCARVSVHVWGIRLADHRFRPRHHRMECVVQTRCLPPTPTLLIHPINTLVIIAWSAWYKQGR